MNLPELSDWVEKSGLTLKECAMIQPAYGDPVDDDPISLEYGLASSILTGTNIAFNAVNTAQIATGSSNTTVPSIGLITGGIQIGYGVFNLSNEELNALDQPVNQRKRTLSMFNIGMGSTTVVLSLCNVILNKEKKSDKDTSWNLFSYPADQTEIGLGVTFTRQF